MRTSAIIVTLSLLGMPALASDVYRSIDEQGNVVYSDRPGDESAVKVVVAAAQAPAPAANVAGRLSETASSEPAAEPDEETIAAAERAQRTQDRAANCEIARQRALTYSQSRRLYEVAESGERVYYNDAELSQARLDAEAEVARWCG